MSAGAPSGAKSAPSIAGTSSSVVIFDAASRSRESLTFAFEREDYEVFSTDRAEEALGMVRIADSPLMVVSIGAEVEPRAAALSFIGELRDSDERKGLAVVALGRRDVREDALRAGADEFVSWPAFIRDAVTLARLAVARRAEQGHGGLQGLLEDYEIYFLVRALASAGRSAIIEVERDGHKGHIHFVSGEVTAARAGRLGGVAAFHHLLLWGEASLRLRFVSPPGERKISTPIDDLLQGGVAFVGQFEKLAERIGGPQATFEKRPERWDDPSIKVPPEVRRFADIVVGGAPLVDLVEDSPFKPFDTIKVCYRLCELGLVTRRDPVRSISPLTAQLAVRDWLLGTTAPEQRSTVTEAGRRAAEAYAEASAERGKVEAEEELFGFPAAAAVPAPVTDEAPTLPRDARPSPSASPSPGARNKPRGSDKLGAPREVAPKEKSGRLSREAVAQAPAKEAIFDDLDEAFFAKESELQQVAPVETFDDLDQNTVGVRRLSAKRKWSLFGDDKPAPPPAKKKR